MSLIRTFTLFGALLSVNFATSAACHITSQKMMVSPETMTMKRAQQSGAILHSRTLALNNFQFSNCTENMAFSAKILGDKSVLLLPGIMRTNVRGVGVKITLEMSSGRSIQWPSDFNSTADELKGSKIKIELIKMEGHALGGGKVGNINLQVKSERQSAPIIDLMLPGDFINVIHRSCEIEGDKTRNVHLQGVELKHFKGRGSVTGSKPFSIDLICEGGMAENPGVNITWTHPTLPFFSDKGVLLNSPPYITRGVGIQVLHQDQSPVNFFSVMRLNLSGNSDGRYSIPLFARYYQYGDKASPGKISTSVKFGISYQ